MQRIRVIYTGGTIGMLPGSDGYAPAPDYLQQQLQSLYPGLSVLEYSPLLDSSEMTPALWNRIAADIAADYDDYDGFVVLHGTDTMAYTASALSYMLENLAKPVVVTGSQIPWCEPGNDAIEHVAAALALASVPDFCEVAVVFAGLCLRGNRVRKVDCDGMAAFASPNLPALGLWQAGHWEMSAMALAMTKPTGSFRLQPVAENARIVAAKLAPGFSAEWLASSLTGLDGVVLETFGAGNAGSQPALMKALAEQNLVVNCTPCLQGSVKMGRYAVSGSLTALGVLDGADMTPEAALAKLYYVQAKGMDRDERAALFLAPHSGDRLT
ncbi:asparaginase domain-containing protein [Iodobacter sp. LRB]|uniref:asparaginase domain-containing protein n=1 Tax=unclassified Iodobacter TaxID=235634 RepID=UPI000C0D7CC3|nr:asparaginase domain-containing protein [Iodobacter sp. BJB302]PHV00644.1 L-asparaginase 1 [Iodobacter sp. BJB302]